MAVILTTGGQPDGRCKGPEVGKGWRDFKRTPGGKTEGGHLTCQQSRALGQRGREAGSDPGAPASAAGLGRSI